MQGWFNTQKAINKIYHTNKIKNKNHTIFLHLIDAERISDKIPGLFTTKTLKKLGTENNFFDVIKITYKNLTDSNILNGERLDTFPPKLQGSPLATSIQHQTGGSSQGN